MSRPLVLLLLVVAAFSCYTLADDTNPRCEALNIRSGRSLLDAPVKEHYYASADQRDIYVLTEHGTVYRSQDYGQSWANKMGSFPQWNNASLVYPPGRSGVKHIHGAGVDNIVYFEGYGLAYWVTRGDDHFKLYTTGQVVDGQVVGDLVTKLIAHPTNAVYILRMAYDATCFASDFATCSQKTEVSAFQGADHSWEMVNDYTFLAAWGGQEDQIYVTTMEEENRLPNQNEVGTLDPGREMIVYGAFGAEDLLRVRNVLTFHFVNNVLYFAKYLDDGSLHTYLTADISSATEMIFNGSSNYTAVAFEILPSASDVSFVAVRSSRDLAFGSLFQSATEDGHYWMSLPFIRMNGNGADFYETKDLPGIFLANGYRAADLDNDLNSLVQSYISYDKGGLWHRIYNTDNETINLFISHEYTDQPTRSSSNAVGILYSLGNQGEYRQHLTDDVGLYLSRTGGYRWERVLDGRHYFSFNSHASLVVALEAPGAVSDLHFSWDQAMNWESCTWGAEAEFNVRSVHSLSNFPNGHFLVFGEYPNGQGTILALDFEGNVPRVCSDEDNDFELFEPALGGVCLLGQANAYPRRKRESACSATGTVPVEVTKHTCGCTRLDYQCDGECFREQHVEGRANTVCINICEGTDDDPMLAPFPCVDNYVVTQGYRKVPGDQCQGGDAAEYDPITVPCPQTAPTPTSTASVTPKPPTQTPSPTLSVKPSDLVEPSSTSSHSPGPSRLASTSPAPKTPSNTQSPTVSLKLSPSASSLESVSSPTHSPASSPSASPSFTSSNTLLSSVSASMSPATTTPTMTPKKSVDEVVDSPAGSPMDSSADSPNSPDSPAASPAEETKVGINWVIIGSVSAGVLGVCLTLTVIVSIVVVVKWKASRTFKKKGTVIPDSDVFSLEDNDEWEL